MWGKCGCSLDPNGIRHNCGSDSEDPACPYIIAGSCSGDCIHTDDVPANYCYDPETQSFVLCDSID